MTTNAMSPDFDEPMELVESKRLRYLEGLERMHQAGPSISTPPAPKPCPQCGQPMIASTPAVAAPVEPPPKKQNETWHDREPLL